MRASLPITSSVPCNAAAKLFQYHEGHNQVPFPLGCWLVHPGVAILRTELEIYMHVLLVSPKPHAKN